MTRPIALAVDRLKSELTNVASRSLAHIDPAVMEVEELKPGDVIRIGTETTRYPIPARVGEPYDQDRGSGLIRLDRFLRTATKAKINQQVEISRVESVPVLESVTLMPPIDVSTAHHLVEHLVESFVTNRTPLGRGSVVYATFHDSTAGTTYKVTKCQPDFGVVSERTKIHVDVPASGGVKVDEEVTFEDVGGMTSEIKLVRELIQLPLQFPQVYRQLGILPPRGIIVYGPPGNGKSVISQQIRELLEGDIAVPHALEVEGQVVRLFDPVVHDELFEDDEDAGGLDAGRGPDRRWVRCRRPLVTVGGELTLEALELTASPGAGYYRAPVQALANGGLLVIDDFGRQRCSPAELLNRWIGPLETRVDYLVLGTGQRFEMPFSVLIAFATNLKPSDLVDEAFLRRIHFKVFAESPSVADFRRIFEVYCRQCDLEFDEVLVEDLLQNYYHPRQIPLRGCHPRDLIDQTLALANYLGQPRRLTRELLHAACASYFVDDREPLTEYA